MRKRAIVMRYVTVDQGHVEAANRTSMALSNVKRRARWSISRRRDIIQRDNLRSAVQSHAISDRKAGNIRKMEK